MSNHFIKNHTDLISSIYSLIERPSSRKSNRSCTNTLRWSSLFLLIPLPRRSPPSPASSF